MASLAREGSAVLQKAGVPDAARDAEVLLAHALGLDRAGLHLRPGDPVAQPVAARYRDLLSRRASRVPLQHLTGVQEFWSLRFEVTPAVLVPRPETEGIVEAFLNMNRRPDPVVLDLGTGSGCLAVAVAREVPGARVHAIDISAEALEVARRNAEAHGVASRIAFHRGDLFEPLRDLGLAGRIDAILSNPPYIGEAEIGGLEPEVARHEPRLALVPGRDALALHRRLAAESPAYLGAEGRLVVEIGQGQAPALAALYAAAGLEVIEVRPDLAGIPRVLVARIGRGAAVPATASR